MCVEGGWAPFMYNGSFPVIILLYRSTTDSLPGETQQKNECTKDETDNNNIRTYRERGENGNLKTEKKKSLHMAYYNNNMYAPLQFHKAMYMMPDKARNPIKK